MPPDPKQRPTVSTGAGDDGQTVLFGGKRVSKSSPRVRAYGTVDELNAAVGMVLAEEGISDSIREQLVNIQKFLFRVGADLALSPEGRVEEADVAQLEQWGVELEKDLPALDKFILPGGSRAGALLHFARTVCRRAERLVVVLSQEEELNPQVQICLNRLSDYFFLAARSVNQSEGVEEMQV